MKPKFSSGDKVFAKVRGYPPWPARVEGLADETPNKMRYHVYFYGTGETAVVKAEDICSYIHNKVRLGKTKKTKNFLEAVLQIEAGLSSEEKQILADIEANPPTETPEGGQHEESGASKRTSGAGKQKTPSSKPRAKEKKRKIDNDSGTDEPEQRQLRTSIVSSSDTESTPNVATKTVPVPEQKKLPRSSFSSNEDIESKNPEVMSRSGRKIKPRRFADFEDGDGEEELPTQIGQVNKTPTIKTVKGKSIDKDEDENEEYVIASVKNEKIKIPLLLNKPDFISKKANQLWMFKVKKYANNLKKRLESGETLPTTIEEHMDQWTKNEAMIEDRHINGVQCEQLREEAKLLDLDLNIRTALSIKSPDIPKSLELLDKLANMKLTALMLKKHPDVVSTIKKVRRYIGCIPRSYTAEEERQIRLDATAVRNRAEHVLNKFQLLFFVPPNKTFWEVFDKEKEKFDELTKDWSSEDIVGMTEEPEEIQ